MRRKQIINTIRKIQQAITDSELLERLDVRILALSNEGEGEIPNIGDLLAALNKFSIATSEFTDAEKEVLRLLDLHYLNNPKNWAKLISTDQPDLLASLFSNLRRLRSSLAYFQKVISIGHDELVNCRSKEETIAILLLPDKNTTVTPRRVASTLESVQQLYNCFVTLEHIENPEELTIIGMDSGNEKSIELKGEAVILEKMKELLYSVWMQILPSRNQHLSDKFKLVSESLPIFKRIEELSTFGRIEKEKAALIQRQLTTSLEGLIRSNTITEDVYNHWVKTSRIALQNVEKKATQEEPDFATQIGRSLFLSSQEEELIATPGKQTTEQKVKS